MVDAQREIEELVGFEGRWAGTEAERRAADHLAEKLRGLGREAATEPVTVWPNYPLTHLIHALMGIVGSVLSVTVPLVGVVLLFLTAISTLGDLTGSVYLVRRLTGRRASQNVVSREGGDKGGTLVLVAHYDAARTGAVFSRRALERRASFGQLIRRPIGPFEPFFWSIVVVLACAVVRLVGIESTALTVVQFIPTVLLILSVPLLADIALSPVVPGANDNASGVATALRLAERHGGKLEHFDVWVLLPGAEEALVLGMRGWIKAHRGDLDPQRTVFLNVDQVGHGTVRYLTKEGLVFAYPYHPQLIELCREIAEDDEEEGRFGARGKVSRLITDALAARTAGFPAITIECMGALDYAPNYHQLTDTPDRVDPDALERAFGFCSALVERVDAQIGPDLERDLEETQLAEG